MKILASLLAVSATLLLGAAVLVPQDKEQDAAKAKADAAKAVKVRTLLTLTGADKMGKQMLKQMMAQFAKMPQLPEGFADKFVELAKKEDLVSMIVPVYVKHLEEKDIDATIEYFGTPSGKRWLAAQPKILQESTTIGQKWGQQLAMKVMRELRK
ncbi:MAG: DUF2059 domain-containing protein [Planctomycetes bacterium]|nr:DUF2059 domain-containing protein [Planctomycetota bacterium]